MDIGQDLFLQMLKGTYPEYMEKWSKETRELFQKATRSLFEDISDNELGYNQEALFKKWMEKTQEALGKGKWADDLEIPNQVMQQPISRREISKSLAIETRQASTSTDPHVSVSRSMNSWMVFNLRSDCE